jgi:hypothetical protein
VISIAAGHDSDALSGPPVKEGFCVGWANVSIL